MTCLDSEALGCSEEAHWTMGAVFPLHGSLAVETAEPRMCSVDMGRAVTVTEASPRRALWAAGLSLWPSSHVAQLSGSP